MKTYSDFENKQKELQKLASETDAIYKSVNLLFTTFQHDKFKQLYPKKRKFNYTLIKDNLEVKSRFEKDKSFLDGEFEKYWQAKKIIEKNLFDLAQEIEINKTKEFILWKTVGDSDYATQGFGATHYAKGRANEYYDHAIFYGLECEVKRIEKDKDKSYLNGFEVCIKTDSIGAQILDKKEGIDLKTWLKNCWRRGVNPRVLNPFLPDGLEEKFGIDYFGGDIVKKSLDLKTQNV